MSTGSFIDCQGFGIPISITPDAGGGSIDNLEIRNAVTAIELHDVPYYNATRLRLVNNTYGITVINTISDLRLNLNVTFSEMIGNRVPLFAGFETGRAMVVMMTRVRWRDCGMMILPDGTTLSLSNSIISENRGVLRCRWCTVTMMDTVLTNNVDSNDMDGNSVMIGIINSIVMLTNVNITSNVMHTTSKRSVHMISLSNSQIEMLNCSVANNVIVIHNVGDFGATIQTAAALLIAERNSTVILSGGTFSNNSVSISRGTLPEGCTNLMMADGGWISMYRMTITNNTITGHRAVHEMMMTTASILWFNGSYSLDMIDVVISGNSAGDGSALAISNSKQVHLKTVNLTDNSYAGMLLNASTVVLTQCKFYNNNDTAIVCTSSSSSVFMDKKSLIEGDVDECEIVIIPSKEESNVREHDMIFWVVSGIGSVCVAIVFIAIYVKMNKTARDREPLIPVQ